MKKAKRNEAIEETCNCLLKEFIGDKTLPEFIDILCRLLIQSVPQHLQNR